MAKQRLLVVAAVVVAALLLVVALIYWIEPAKSLPGFFPGHASGGGEASHQHVKHGIAAFAVALAALAFAWFQTGPAARHRSAPTGAG